jgi:CRP/FNR family cyclic AMP-dependent transcriptional regulator
VFKETDALDAEAFEARGMRSLGPARAFAEEMHRLIAHSPLIEELTLAEVTALGEYMEVYEAAPQVTIIGEGEVGDYMIMVISGTIDVMKRGRDGVASRIAVVQAGHALGEMSMLDGEPRFASCVSVENTRFAVLTRRALPGLGAKILVKLVHILAQRLRNTSMKLVNTVESMHASEP